MGKRIAICMDGTWQQLRQENLTNIGAIARSVAHTDPQNGAQQIVIYTQGVGSTIRALQGKGEGGLTALATSLASFAGGVFGDGLENSILDTYLRLAFNYEPDDEIYIFGFSRGAFSARSLAALIGKCGIVSRRFAEKATDAFDLYRDRSVGPYDTAAREFREAFGKRVRDTEGQRRQANFRPPISYLGIFDTVGQRGLPSMLGPLSEAANRRFSFHDLDLGDHVRSARHALAIDERRAAFPPTLWTNIDALNANARALNNPQSEPFQQRWFVGAHGDIGGGVGSSLSSFPLEWVVEGAEVQGLKFDRSAESPLSRQLAPEQMTPLADISMPRGIGSLKPINLVTTWRQIGDADVKSPADPDATRALMHLSVAARTVAPLKKPYRPKPLAPYRDSLATLAAPAALAAELVAFVTGPKRKRSLFQRLFGR